MLGLLLAAGIVGGLDTTPAPATPTSTWELDDSNNKCLASRAFTGPDALLNVSLPALSGRYTISVDFHAPIPIDYGETITLLVGRTGREVRGDATGFPPTGDRHLTIGLAVPLETFAVPTLSPLRLIVQGKVVASLAAGDPTALVNALRACETSLLQKFGIDPTVNADVSTPPAAVGGPAAWLKPQDYPLSALRAHQMGQVGMRFAVSPSGKVVDCETISSSGSATLDRTSCAIMTTRGRYTPALNAAGHPIRATQIIFIRWDLPAG